MGVLTWISVVVDERVAYLCRALKTPRVSTRSLAWRIGPGKRNGATRTSWPSAWSGRLPCVSTTVASIGFEPPASRPKDHRRLRLRSSAQPQHGKSSSHLGALDFALDNVVFLGPLGTGKTHLASVSPSAPARPSDGTTGAAHHGRRTSCSDVTWSTKGPGPTGISRSIQRDRSLGLCGVRETLGAVLVSEDSSTSNR